MKTVICTDKDKKEHEVPVEKLLWRPSVYAVIIKDDKILLSRQWDGYDFPGGGIDKGEDIKDALIREIKEETGFEGKVGRIVTCESSLFTFGKGDYYHSLLLYYMADITGGEASIAGAAHAELEYIGLPEWVPIENIEKIKFYNSVDSVAIIRTTLELL